MSKTEMSAAASIREKLQEVVAKKGADLYGGEAVTQEQHALQCAQLAENNGAQPSLIVAALLHDIGHLFEDHFDDALEHEKDRVHEELGEHFLKDWFGQDVTEPVRLHVAAKRYLCAVDAPYHDTLSPASKHSLMLQGGPMSDVEVAEFERNPFFREAVHLRRWDDLAKDPEIKTARLEHFLEYVSECMKPAKAI